MFPPRTEPRNDPNSAGPVFPGRRAAGLVLALTVLLGTALSAALPASAAGFAVLSYNVKGLPFPLIGDREDQIEDIAERLEDFHSPQGNYAGIPSVVGLQEVFANQYYDILTDPGTVSYGYVTDKDRRGELDTGDGLTVLSDFLLEGHDRTRWDDCSGSLGDDGSDCDTAKGFTFTEVTLEPGVSFDLYTLHADAGQDFDSRKARRANIRQLIEAIQLRSPEGRPLIVLGDTNARYTRLGNDNLQELLAETGVRDVWVELLRGGVVPPAGPDLEEDCYTTPSTAECEEPDKIFYRSGATLMLEPVRYEVLREMFLGTQRPLSDHDPVAAEFDYTVVTTTTISTTTSTTMPAEPACGRPGPEAVVAAGQEPLRTVSAGDALQVLRAGVGVRDCPLCLCDTDGNGTVSAADALAVLRVAVGQDMDLLCPPCQGEEGLTPP